MATATAKARARRGAAKLPVWDLGDLYAGPESPALGRDIERARAWALAFATKHKGKVAALDGAGLGAAIADYEKLQDLIGRIGSYAQLLHAADMADAAISRFNQTTHERITAITTELLFFALEINRIDDAALAEKTKAPALARYAPWLRDIRSFRPHQLSDDLEKILHEKDIAGRAAFVRLFDETFAHLRFPVRGKKLASQEALNLLSDKNPALRRAAAKSLGKVFAENARLFALLTNTLAKDKEIEDRWRHFPLPASSRHLANQVEPEVVDALVGAVRESYPRLSHRYYALKAKWLGKKRLDYWDRNAPLPEDSDRKIPWTEAVKIVLDSYGRFSPDLAAIGARFFDKPWIDAGVRQGKAPGAFAHGTVPSAHPYLLLNYQGRTRDVMTLAHELGHGVHQVLAAGQGALMAETPLTLAETASVFGEQLAFRALLDAEKNPRRRRIMLASKVEDMLNTVVRQIAFYDFERRLHDERRAGEVSVERIGDIWMAVQTESLGPVFRFDPEYRTYWCYIPHFVHSPFYVYAYAFGDCLVNSLYAVYAGAAKGFQAKYLDMLRAGGSKRHKDLLAPFGLDATDPGFWSKGLAVIGDFVDRLEAE